MVNSGIKPPGKVEGNAEKKDIIRRFFAVETPAVFFKFMSRKPPDLKRKLHQYEWMENANASNGRFYPLIFIINCNSLLCQ